MKKVFPLLALLIVFGIVYAFVFYKGGQETNSGELTWYSWEEALRANEKKPKKILVDVYTDWCGWCKKMDQETFTDPAVIDYLNKYFYVVKLDAEQKGSIEFQGNEYTYRADQGRRGVHELAVALLNGRMSYPSIVYLNEKFERITVAPGYKTPASIMPELRFVGESHYTTKNLDQFMQEVNQSK